MSVDYARIRGHDVYSREGEKIGKLQEIYTDNRTGRPVFATVRTGLLGNRSSFVPLVNAEQAGEDLSVPYSKDQVKQAPSLEADADLSPAEEVELFSYYQVAAGRAAGDDAGTRVRGTDDVDQTGRADQRAEGRDVSGPTTDDAMTRSEERVRTGKETVEAGRARLRKYVVTETVTQTVPVSHEEIRVEREPITEDNRGAATAGPEISDEEHEVVLHEERPVTTRETVPVERVRLGTETVTEEATVSEDVRKERIELRESGESDDRESGR